MKQFYFVIYATLLASCAILRAQDGGPASYEQKVEQRIAEALKPVHLEPTAFDPKRIDRADSLALLLLFKNENVEEANRLVLAYCGSDRMTTYVGKPVPKGRCEALLRIYLLERTHKLLSKDAREAIEDFAWELLTKYPLGMSRDTVEKAELAHFLLPNNGQTNKWRRYYLSLLIVRQAERYGPKAMLEGDTIENHCRAWDRFWVKFFHIFPNEGTDMDIAHPSSYGECTVGVFYDLFDLADDPEVRRLAGNFLTLFWAEVAAEFNPKTGERVGMATTRWHDYTGSRTFWARPLLHCYLWHDNDDSSPSLGMATFLTSSYRPPEIVTAIARNRNRGCYLATSRRPGMTGGEGIEVTDTSYRGDVKNSRIVVDKNGDSHFRRDVYYTPDYALGTMTTDPKCSYISDVVLTPNMGATFATGLRDRIVVVGTGYYPLRPTSGITGKAVSIIARDPNAKFGNGERFASNGTRVFVSNGNLWNNRIEDASGWFFTRSGDAYAAIRPSGNGYHTNITDKTWTFNAREVGRKLTEVVEKNGHFLELNDMWAPVVIQMGRAADYKSFEDFQNAVKTNRFEYTDGKLTYVSAAGDKYEYWAKGVQPPRINGTEVNLNPPKTFDSPFLSMEHGSSKAVITCPGYQNLARI
jgi:hypothetical protein